MKKIFFWIISASILTIFSALVVWTVISNEQGYEKIMRGRLTSSTPIIDDAPAEEEPLYSSRFSAGLCRGPSGEDGGCYTELYLFQDGRFEKKVGFIYVDNRREVLPTVEKQLDDKTVNSIIKIISDANLSAKDCPPERILDASWNYEINLSGKTATFRNPPEQCKSVFESINKILDPK